MKHSLKKTDAFKCSLQEATVDPLATFGREGKLADLNVALQANEQRIQQALRVSHSFTFEWLPTTDQVRRSASSALILKLVGDDTCNDTGERYFKRVHVDDRARFLQTLHDLAPDRASYTTEYRVVRGDGGIAVLEETGEATFDSDGKLERVVGVSTDITSRKQAEEQLFNTTQRLQALMAAVPVGISFSDDITCQHITGNPAVLAQFDVMPTDNLSASAPSEDDPGRKVKFFIDGRPIGDHELPLQRAVAENRMIEPFELEVLMPSGRRWIAEASGAPVRDGRGNVISGIAVTVDISERKRVEDALRQLNAELEERVASRTAELSETNRELEAFCYSVSHDLRAPLRSMDGFSQALLDDYGPQLDDAGHDFLNRIRSNCQRMARLIDDLLHLSRLTRSQMSHQPVNLTALAQAIIAEHRQAEPERVVDVRIASGMVVTGDPVLLRAALANLLQNAWKFTSLRPDAVIEAGQTVGSEQLAVGRQPNGTEREPEFRSASCVRCPASSPIFFVRDNGVGFDMQYADKLFTPFQRLHAMTDFPGSGIGLATVQRVINRHNGRIWFEAAPGKGATFYFTIGAHA